MWMPFTFKLSLALHKPFKQSARSKMALRLSLLALVAIAASTTVLAHEGHDHGTKAGSMAGSMAGSHHEEKEAGEHGDHSSVKNSTATTVPTPSPTSSASSGAVFAIALPLSAAAIATIAAAH